MKSGKIIVFICFALILFYVIPSLVSGFIIQKNPLSVEYSGKGNLESAPPGMNASGYKWNENFGFYVPSLLNLHNPTDIRANTQSAAWKRMVDYSGIMNILLPNNAAKTQWNSRAGIALTFDDRSVDQWYEIRDLLKKYNAHATFFVTLCGGDLDQDQINKLRELAADGNEIGFHGTNHIDATLYLQNHSIQDYLDYEIHPGLNQMTNAGFDVVDFAYPSGSDDKNLNVELQKYFLHIRGTAYSDINDPLKDVDGVYYHYGSHQKIIHGIGIDDESYGNSLNDIYHGIARAKKENTILIFYGHMPVKTITGDYQISYDRLEKILINTSENNLTFYKISEIN